MDQRDFNRSMGAYLNARRGPATGPGFFDRLKGSMPRVELEANETEVVGGSDVPQEAIDAVLRGESIAPQVVEEPVVRTPRKAPVRGWFRRMVDSFTITLDDEDMMDDGTGEAVKEVAPPRVDDEVKEMLRICVHWINQMPPERIQEIKRSDDFAKFTKLLNKYGLLKK